MTDNTPIIIIPAISNPTTNSSKRKRSKSKSKKHKSKKQHSSKKKRKVAVSLPTCSFCGDQGHMVTTCPHPALKALEGKPVYYRRFLLGRYFYKKTPKDVLKLKVYKCLRGYDSPHDCSRECNNRQPGSDDTYEPLIRPPQWTAKSSTGRTAACEECVFVLRMVMILKSRLLNANPEAKGTIDWGSCKLIHDWVISKPNMTITYEFGCPGEDKHAELAALAHDEFFDFINGQCLAEEMTLAMLAVMFL